MFHAPARSTPEDQLLLVQDRLLGHEGIWIEEDDWRELATYEHDTNAWVDDPYDRVSADQVVEDGQALAEAIAALRALVPVDAEEAELLQGLRTDGLALARSLVDSGGRARGPRGHLLGVPDIAEELHRRWADLEELWLARVPVAA